MPRKPNYDFERKERERIKNEKKAARASEKVKPASPEVRPSTTDADEQREGREESEPRN
jgi:hypothetical protein